MWCVILVCLLSIVCAFFSGTLRIQIIFILLNVVKDVGQVGKREIILIGNRKIKRQRQCHDVKTTNLNGREFKWGYSITIRVCDN